MELDILKDKKVAELREIAKALGVKGASGMKKKEIVDLLTRMHEEAEKEKAAAAEKEAKKAAPKTPSPSTFRNPNPQQSLRNRSRRSPRSPIRKRALP